MGIAVSALLTLVGEAAEEKTELQEDDGNTLEPFFGFPSRYQVSALF